MCGIGGWIGLQGESEQLGSRMIQALHHRGPDGHGMKSWSEATLIHTRLSIIDLSPAGAQPISNEDGTVWAVFNGEIYNHRDLRKSLTIKGHRFKGRSDSEILPHLYEEDGPDFVTKLRGMFALAIYDSRTRTMVLARDRFGVKPLFYAIRNNRLAFGSEIRAILTLPGIDTRPDRQAIHDFAALFYIPAPETFYKGIRSLQPGEILEAQLDGADLSCKTRHYHRWTIALDRAITPDRAVDRAEALVGAAVGAQMESDVPLGTLLSGGIDSSLVSEAAQAASNSRLRTFNVRFSDHEYDETWAALAVAQHIGSDHTTLDMDNVRGTWEQITHLLLHAGQPFADTSLFAVNAVCRLMRRHVTVALSGDGGDEAFGGYSTYWQLARIARLQMLPRPLWYGVAAAIMPLAWTGLIHQYLPDRMKEVAGADDISVVQGLSSWIREKELALLCVDHGKLLPIRRLFEPQWEYHLGANASRLERLSAYTTEIGVRQGLSDDFLFKVDTASMKESLEVRVPMLDEDLFAFGLSLPHDLKVRGRMCKRILRGVADRRLPPAVARKPKWGFGIPVDKWVDAPFKTRLREELLGPASRLSEFFRPEAYRPIVEAFCGGYPCPNISRQGLYQRAIMLLSVQLIMARSS